MYAVMQIIAGVISGFSVGNDIYIYIYSHYKTINEKVTNVIKTSTKFKIIGFYKVFVKYRIKKKAIDLKFWKKNQ